MGTVTVTTFTSDTETVTRTKLNGLAANLVTEFNGNIDNANIKAAAAIAATKLNLATIAQNVAFTGTLDFSGATITAATTFADLTATTIDINGGTLAAITIDGNWTAAGQTCADLGAVTTSGAITTGGKLTAGANEVEGSNFDINGGNIDGTTLGAAATVTVTDLTMSLGSDADGDVYYRTSNKLARLAKGTASQQLAMNSGATAPEWITPKLIYRGTDNFDTAANSDNITIDGTEGNIIYVCAKTQGRSDSGGSGKLLIQLGTTTTNYFNVAEVRNVTDASTAYVAESTGFWCGDTGESDWNWAMWKIHILDGNTAIGWGTGRYTDSSNKDQVGQVSGFYTGSTAHTTVRAILEDVTIKGDIWVWESVA